MSENSEELSLTDAHEAIEEKKTRLWAMSFESTKQIVHCAKCGATNVVNRLIEEHGTLPSRRTEQTSSSSDNESKHKFRTTESEVTQAAKRLLLEAQLGEAKQEALEVRKKLKGAKKTAAITTIFSVLMAAASVAVIFKTGKRR